MLPANSERLAQLVCACEAEETGSAVFVQKATLKNSGVGLVLVLFFFF